jgi:hypothetical protein
MEVIMQVLNLGLEIIVQDMKVEWIGRMGKELLLRRWSDVDTY